MCVGPFATRDGDYKAEIKPLDSSSAQRYMQSNGLISALFDERLSPAVGKTGVFVSEQKIFVWVQVDRHQENMLFRIVRQNRRSEWVCRLIDVGGPRISSRPFTCCTAS